MYYIKYLINKTNTKKPHKPTYKNHSLKDFNEKP